MIVFESGLGWAYCVAIFCCHADCLNQFYSKYCYWVQMAYQAWPHQPMVVEPEEATKRPSGVDKVTGNGHRHRRQSPYLVAKPLSDPFPIFVLNHYLPLPAVFRPPSLWGTIWIVNNNYHHQGLNLAWALFHNELPPFLCDFTYDNSINAK